MPDLVQRRAQSLVEEALGDTRVVLVMGPRQAGKSTLLAQLAARYPGLSVVTLDERTRRLAAAADPTGFVAGLPRPVAIDEIQRVPDLLPAIKQVVDTDPRPGQFILTGSSNVLTNRRVMDALPGRTERVTLWPLSQAEIHRPPATFIDSLLAGSPPDVTGAPVGRDAFAAVAAAGGFPEALDRAPRRRDRWFADYVTTVLTRDARDLSDAQKLWALPRLLRLLAAQSSGMLTYATIAQKLQLHPTTVASYVGLLEGLFLVHLLPSWRPGLGAREVHAPKVTVTDSGLLAHLLGADESRLRSDDQVTGPVLESFVAMEMLKQATWAARDVGVYHYRRDRDEVDLVLETRAGDLAAVEVRATASPTPAHWARLAKLRDGAGARFRAGALIYSGADTVPLGDRLWAIPVAGLWTPSGRPEYRVPV